MRINFDFMDLEAFLAVMDTGTFHLASEKLGLSQSSVTRRIQKLEEALGVQLFVRTTRAVKPTLAAKQLRIRAEAILNDAIETTQALRDESTAFAFQRAHTITIAALPTTIARVLAPAIAEFRKTYPHTRFRILDLAANDVAEAVASSDADIGICSAPAFEPATQFENLFVDEMVLAVHAGHSFATKAVLSWSEAAEESMVLPARGTGNRMLIDDALARAGVPREWTMEVGRTATALQLARSGIALAPVPRSAVDKTTEPSISVIPLVSPTVSRAIGLLSKAGQMPNSNLQEFRGYIKRYIADG